MIKLLFFVCIYQILNPAALYPQNRDINTHQKLVLNIKYGFSKKGTITSEWLKAIRYLRNKQNLSVNDFDKRKPTNEESVWIDLIKSKILEWTCSIDSLEMPFKEITPPDEVTILLGNQGGEDAFISNDSTICFDLHKLYRIYGSASEKVNRRRINRFFAHEFTHILHRVWKKKNKIKLISPLDCALWECLTEGLGNYRSLSEKWLMNNGELTKHAKEVLNHLQPIFVHRISLLKHADNEEAEKLMQGLSMGQFEKKWGALTVALWLSQEAKRNEVELQKWIDAGPHGILSLARKYLPEELRKKL